MTHPLTYRRARRLLCAMGAVAGAVLLSARAEAAIVTTASASHSLAVDVQFAFDTTTGQPAAAQFTVEGQTGVSASARAEGLTAREASEERSTVVITNTSDTVEITFRLTFFLGAEASTSVDELPEGTFLFDGNGLGGSAFASTNGTLTCGTDAAGAPTESCFGFSDGEADFSQQVVTLTLDPGGSASFDLVATAFAGHRFEAVAAVPAPMALALFAPGFALVWAARRRVA